MKMVDDLFCQTTRKLHSFLAIDGQKPELCPRALRYCARGFSFRKASFRNRTPTRVRELIESYAPFSGHRRPRIDRQKHQMILGHLIVNTQHIEPHS
jgi:hypothetical protein